MQNKLNDALIQMGPMINKHAKLNNLYSGNKTRDLIINLSYIN